GSKELMWLIAFLAGFSDRFADGMLKSLVGKFGGDRSSELVSVEPTSASTLLPPLSPIIDGIGKFVARIKPSSLEREGQTEKPIGLVSESISNNGNQSEVVKEPETKSVTSSFESDEPPGGSDIK